MDPKLLKNRELNDAGTLSTETRNTLTIMEASRVQKKILEDAAMTDDRPDWHEYFMAVAKLISTRSTCNSRPTGAILVKNRHILATGYNGSPPGAPHCRGNFNADGTPFCYSRHVGAGDADKYNYCRSSHAEANAVAQAARLGIAVEGAAVYTTLAPCYICTKLLAAARISEVYFEHDYESSDRSRDRHWESIFKESGITVWQKVTLSPGSMASFAEAFSGITSGRRLGTH